MRKIWRLFGIAAAVFTIATASLLGWLGWTAVSAADIPPLRTGDIVFQYSGSSQSVPILLASRSTYTHMGIVELDDAGKAWVVEAVGPGQTISLDEWIESGVGGRITVKRMRNLAKTDAERVLASARKYHGLPYDIYFLEGADEIYCSELVHLAFKEGAGIEVGRVQKVRELDLDYAPVRKLIEARWNRHPLCRNGAAGSFDACYRVILDQTLITPESISQDEKLELVFSNFGIAGT